MVCLKTDPKNEIVLTSWLFFKFQLTIFRDEENLVEKRFCFSKLPIEMAFHSVFDELWIVSRIKYKGKAKLESPDITYFAYFC